MAAAMIFPVGWQSGIQDRDDAAAHRIERRSLPIVDRSHIEYLGIVSQPLYDVSSMLSAAVEHCAELLV